MNPSAPYTGAFPRKRHSHTCLTCKTRGQGAVACYKSHCTKPQRIDMCACCRPLYPSVTAPARAASESPANETAIAQWYVLIAESQRASIFSALSESQRRLAFEYGLALSWHRLPPYARDLVRAEWHNTLFHKHRPDCGFLKCGAAQTSCDCETLRYREAFGVTVESDSGRTQIGNTPTCEDCGEALDSCTCDAQLDLFGGAL